MQKLKLLLFSGILMLSFSNTFGQSWIWERQGSGYVGSDYFTPAVAADKDGYAYITGGFQYKIFFGKDTLNGALQNAYFLKYSPWGSIVWAKQLTDIGGESDGKGITTDKSGNIYATGDFWGSAKADTFSLPGGNNMFLIKYNTSGTVLWAKQSVGATEYCSASGCSVATDNSGNIFVSGSFYDTISFGSFKLKGLESYAVNVFLVKYDSNGNVLWAEQSTLPPSSSFLGRAYVTCDGLGNAYITGSFPSASVSFGPYLLSSPYDETSSFLVKYSPSGNVMWAKQSNIGSFNSYCVSNSLVTDGVNNIYITGWFQDTISFGSHTVYSHSNNSIFLSKYDTNGNVIWVKQSSTGWGASSLSSDENNHIYMAGLSVDELGFPDSLRFGSLKFSTPPSFQGSFLMKLDTTGNPACGTIVNNLGDDIANCIASDYSGNYVYSASSFTHTLFFGVDTLAPEIGQDNTFLGRWLPCGAIEGLASSTIQSNNIVLFPNPSNGIFQLQANGQQLMASSIVEVYNMLGEKVYSNSLNIQHSTLSIDISNNANGIYLYRVIANTGELIGEGKLIIQK